MIHNKRAWASRITKKVWLDGIGEIILTKRRGSRGMRLSINVNGQIRISMPRYVPYSTAVGFAKKRKDWIIAHQQKNQKSILRDGARISKTYRLHISRASEPGILRTKIIGQRIIITTSYPINSDLVQQKATRACERALLAAAQENLPPLLQLLALKHSFSYKDLRIRKLTSRWGSCSSDKIITLSYFLVQLPDEYIEYVMLHELTHTKHHNHSPDFWYHLDKLVPGAKLKHRQLHDHKPRLEPA